MMAKKYWQPEGEASVSDETEESGMENDPVETPVEPPVNPDDVRPWHGHDNPMEAMYQWVKGELSKVTGSGKAGGG